MPSKEFRPRYASYPPFRLGRHGIGPLRQPFDDAVLSAGAARTQWDLIQNPKRRIFRWRFDEEEGEMFDISELDFMTVTEWKTTDKWVNLRFEYNEIPKYRSFNLYKKYSNYIVVPETIIE